MTRTAATPSVGRRPAGGTCRLAGYPRRSAMTLTSSLRDRIAGAVIAPGETEYTSKQRSSFAAPSGHRPSSLCLEGEF
jgi:hypothetical protein